MSCASKRNARCALLIVAVWAALAATGCLNLPDFDSPAWHSFEIGARVTEGVASYNSLPESDELEFEPALVGTWNEVGRLATWTFEAENTSRYRLTIVEDSYPAVLDGKLVRLGPIGSWIWVGARSTPRASRSSTRFSSWTWTGTSRGSRGWKKAGYEK